MMTVRRRSLMGLFILVSLCSTAPSVSGPMWVHAAQVKACHRASIHPDCSTMPHNPDTHPTHPEIGVSDFAWETFIALNWPADCSGKPLPDKKIGEAAGAPRVWEFYRTPEEVFLPDGRDPTDLKPAVPWACAHHQGFKAPPMTLRLAESFMKVAHQGPPHVEQALLQHAVPCPNGSPPDPRQNGLLCTNGELIPGVPMEGLLKANAIPLVDQHGNYIVHEIRLNPVEFNQIVQRGWYKAQQLRDEAARLRDGEFLALACSEPPANYQSQVPCGHGEDPDKYDQEGATELKIAWRVLNPAEVKQDRYFTTKRTLRIPPAHSVSGQPEDQEVDLGLVGFHMMRKTSTLGWIWATFEHVDSAPVHHHPEDKHLYLFYNSSCHGAYCQTDEVYVQPPYLWNTNPHATQKAVTRQNGRIVPQIPAQLLRFQAEDKPFDPHGRETITAHDDQWLQALKAVCQHNQLCTSSIWQYYRLIGTQWLRTPQNPYDYCNASGPCAIPNPREIIPTTPLTTVSIEPYVQQVSCIVCHTAAQLPGKQVKECNLSLSASKRGCADFSFLLDNAK